MKEYELSLRSPPHTENPVFFQEALGGDLDEVRGLEMEHMYESDEEPPRMPGPEREIVQQALESMVMWGLPPAPKSKFKKLMDDVIVQASAKLQRRMLVRHDSWSNS